MSEMEPDDILEQARGRSRYLRDLGEVKTPDLLDRLLAELARLREAMTPFIVWLDLIEEFSSRSDDDIAPLISPGRKVKVGDLRRVRALLALPLARMKRPFRPLMSRLQEKCPHDT